MYNCVHTAPARCEWVAVGRDSKFGSLIIIPKEIVLQHIDGVRIYIHVYTRECIAAFSVDPQQVTCALL